MIKDFVTAVCKFKEYPHFLSYRKGRVFGYSLLLTILCFLVSIIIPFIMFNVTTGGISYIASELMPEFELKDGTLEMDDSFNYDEAGTYIYIDTSKDIDLSTVRALRGYQQIIALDSEKAYFFSAQQGENTFVYSDFDFEFSKTDMMRVIKKFLPITLAVIFVIIFIFQTIGLFFGALIVSLFGMILAASTKSGLRYGEIYQLTLYSRTLPLLIFAVCSLLGIAIPFGGVIKLIISLVILYVAFTQVKKNNDAQMAASEVIMATPIE